jgi:hypothetical protein
MKAVKWLVVVCAMLAVSSVAYGAVGWYYCTVVTISPQGSDIVLQYKVTGDATTYQALLSSSSNTTLQNRLLATVLTAVSTGKGMTCYTDPVTTNYRIEQGSLANY